MAKYNAILERYSDNKTQTLGKLNFYNENNEHVFSCFTLEPAWKDNECCISCIPKGEYNVMPYSSKKYPNTFKILDVKDRSNVLIHWGNFYKNTEACILVGNTVADIDGDGMLDVLNSKHTLKKLKEAIKYSSFTLLVV
jgi:hypothetical protein